jgi:hypothetical protein
MKKLIVIVKKYSAILWEKFTEFVRNNDPWVIMLILSTILLTIGLIIIIPKQLNKAKLIPLGFSEIEQIEIDAEKQKIVIDPITEYYAKLDDLLNKIFECNNKSLNYKLFKSNNEAFARELEARKNKIWKYEFDLFDIVPICADKVVLSLKNWIDLLPTLGNVCTQFGKNWKYESDDDYVTVVTTSTDSKGNVTISSHQVYDHTHHYYTYYKKQGELSYQLGMKMLKYFPKIKWPGNMLKSSRTNAEGEYAIDRSRRVDRHNQGQLLEITRLWNFGSFYMISKNIILQYNNIYSEMKVWERCKDKAKSISYRTNSSHDEGPIEYQQSEYIKNLTLKIYTKISELQNSILTTKAHLPILKNKIREYIDVTLNGKKGNSNKLKNEIIKLSKELYQRNYPEGIKLNTFDYWLVLLVAFIFACFGALIGFILKVIYPSKDYFSSRGYGGFRGGYL